MGQRELRRVPLDFDAPINKIWEGFLNPYRPPERCKHCDGSGYNEATKRLSDDYYGYSSRTGIGWSENITQDEVEALVEAGRLWDFTRVPINEEQLEVVRKMREKTGHGYWLPYYNGYMPTAEEVNEWNKKGMGHDGINRNILIRIRAKRLGIWGACDKCGGEGWVYLNDKIKELWNNWEGYDPPTGEGYQLWETTSEGSPQSPVFKTPEKLAEWCEANATVLGNQRTSKEKWLKMFINDEVDAGTTMIGKNGCVKAGINHEE